MPNHIHTVQEILAKAYILYVCVSTDSELKYIKEDLLGAVAHVIVTVEKFLDGSSVIWSAWNASSMAKTKFKELGTRQGCLSQFQPEKSECQQENYGCNPEVQRPGVKMTP